MSYDQSYFRNQINKSDAKVTWQYGRMLAFANPRAGAPLRVLDAGCGAGPGLRYLASCGHRAVGIDLVEYPLRVAHDMTPESPLAQSDLNEGLAFRANSFDVILLSEVIEHVQEPDRVLHELYRVLVANGVLVLTTPNLWDTRRFYYPLLGRVWSGYADPTHVHLFDPAKMERALRAAGFVGVKVSGNFKPLRWISSRQLGLRFAVPGLPWIGNTLVARGYKPDEGIEP